MATNFRPQLRRLILFALTMSAASFALASNHDHYKVIELGGLGANLSYANSINNNGVVVGNVQYADGHIQAFIWDSINGIRRIDPTAKQSVANCINDSGVIAGAAQDADGLTDAVLWPRIGQRQSIAWAPFGAAATCINRKGEVVGIRMDGIFEIVDRAFSWPAIDPNSAWNELFSEDHFSVATGINDRGQIAGSVDRQAFVLDPNGTLHLLAGSPNSGPPAEAVAINNRGDALISEFGLASLHDGTTNTPFQTSDPVFPMALNDNDEVVGYVNHGFREAFVWDPASGMLMINELIDTPGWQIFSANAINKHGMIAGYGIKNGRRRAVLLVPVKGPVAQAP